MTRGPQRSEDRSHAEQLQQAKDALVEKALKWTGTTHALRDHPLEKAVAHYRALLAATCTKCGGRGEQTFVGDRSAPYVPCPANCYNGRKR